MSRIPTAVVLEVLNRADSHCEACGGFHTDPMALHHRLPRSAGGLDVAENLMHVHRDCHNVAPGSIHQNPDRSYALGHLVRRGHDPARHAVLTRRDLRQLRSAPVPEPACVCLEVPA